MVKKKQTERDQEVIDLGFEYLYDLGLSTKIIQTYFIEHFSEPESPRRTLAVLRRLGIPDSRILSFYTLLCANEIELQNRYDGLRELGFSDAKIRFHANLLGRNISTIRQRYQSLKEMGFPDEVVQTRTELLLIPSENVQAHYKRLERQGLTGKKKSSLATLLAMDPKKVICNNLAHKRFVRGKLLEDFVQLNGVPSSTIEANVQFAYALGIGYNDGYFLGSHPQTKREKMVWMLTHAMGYRNLTDEAEKRQYVKAVRCFVADHPKYLKTDIKKMEQQKDQLREKLLYYVQLQKGILETTKEWDETKDDWRYSIINRVSGETVCTVQRTDNEMGVYLDVIWQPHPSATTTCVLNQLAAVHQNTGDSYVYPRIYTRDRRKEIRRMKITRIVLETDSDISDCLATCIAETKKEPRIQPALKQALHQLYTLEQ